jgi:polysaccharide chain length determinant protein (PEP-CTERM system associated)
MERQPLQNLQQLKQIRKLVDVAARRKILLISCFLVSIATGLTVYLVQPKVYSSTALLTYEQQKVNPAKMSPETEEGITNVVSTLSAIVLSRTKLEKIIIDEQLYKKEREDLPMEDVVAKMRRNISVVAPRRGNTFNVTFLGVNPKEVARVANSLAGNFIEENVKYREERATATSTYTKSELAMTRDMLNKKDAVMRDYKLKYYNEMADQRASNTARLISLQDQYQNKQNSIQDLERTRILIRDQIALRKQVLENTSVGADASRQARIETDREKLARLQAELRGLQDRYTEEHPKIKNLKRRIIFLEKGGSIEREIDQSTPKEGRRTQGPPDKTLLDLQAQLDNISLSIKKMERAKEEIEMNIKQYNQWIANAPVRESEWSELTREYNELRRHYDTIVGQDLQAGSALNLEKEQKGSQFKVVESAQMAVKPIKPVFPKIMVIFLVIGCGLGGVLAIGMEILDTSFRDPMQLEEVLGVEVICSIPHLSLPKEITRKRLWTSLGSVLLITCGVAIVFAFLYFWKQGRIII